MPDEKDTKPATPDEKAPKPKAAEPKPKATIEAVAKATPDKPALFVDDPKTEDRLLPSEGIASIRPRDPRQVGYVVLGRVISAEKPLRVNLAALTLDQRRDLPLDRCIEIKVEG